MFLLSAPFPGHANAVIVTPTPLKADVVHNTGVVITPPLGAVCFSSDATVYIVCLAIICKCKIKMLLILKLR